MTNHLKNTQASNGSLRRRGWVGPQCRCQLAVLAAEPRERERESVFSARGLPLLPPLFVQPPSWPLSHLFNAKQLTLISQQTSMCCCVSCYQHKRVAVLCVAPSRASHSSLINAARDVRSLIVCVSAFPSLLIMSWQLSITDTIALVESIQFASAAIAFAGAAIAVAQCRAANKTARHERRRAQFLILILA